MHLLLFNNMTEKDKSVAIEKLICDSTPRQEFFMMVILAILMATFGLLIDSSAVIIGSMLIAPILFPILSLSLGIVISDSKLIARSFYTLLKSTAIGVAGAALLTTFFSSQEYGLTDEIIARTEPSLAYVGIAVIAGLAASFALVKPHLSETLPGIAISVSLMPPLAVVGIGIARMNWTIISSSLTLFLINAAGIVFASMLVFSLMNLYLKRKVAKETLEKEELAIAKEKERAEKEMTKSS